MEDNRGIAMPTIPNIFEKNAEIYYMKISILRKKKAR